jgi:hypothetical protein
MDKYEITMTELLRKLSDDYPAGYDFQVLRAAHAAIVDLQADIEVYRGILSHRHAERLTADSKMADLQAQVKEYKDMVHGNAQIDNTYTAIKSGWLNFDPPSKRGDK